MRLRMSAYFAASLGFGVPMQNTLLLRSRSRAYPISGIIIRFFVVLIAAMLVLGLLVRL
jgi:hypothetical protein